VIQKGSAMHIVIYWSNMISFMSELYKYGIGFWIGGGIYSIINMIMNLKGFLRTISYSIIILYQALLFFA